MVVEENKHRGSVVAGMNRCSASKDYKRMQLNFFLPETTVTSSPVVVGTWLEEGSFDNMMSSESDGAEVDNRRCVMGVQINSSTQFQIKHIKVSYA